MPTVDDLKIAKLWKDLLKIGVIHDKNRSNTLKSVLCFVSLTQIVPLKRILGISSDVTRAQSLLVDSKLRWCWFKLASFKQ